MYQTVLIPTDGSDVSLTAAEKAVALTADDGTIHVLAVVEELPLYKQSGKGAKLESRGDEQVRAILDDATAHISNMAEAAGLAHTAEITTGVPHRAIMSYAEEIGADAIVMGKRGRGAAANDILGSTTEKVVKGTSTAVLVVPEG